MGIIGASDVRHIQVLAIDADPIIAESHEKAIDMKRRVLDRSLCVFVIGILLLAITAIVGATS